MIFTLHVICAPYSQQSNLSALQFCQAALTAGHKVRRVFFSGDGVHSGNALSVPPQDELNLVRAWETLAESSGVELVVCVSAALRRGVINQQEANRYSKPQYSLSESFTLSGLGQLVEAALESDRVITFGNHGG